MSSPHQDHQSPGGKSASPALHDQAVQLMKQYKQQYAKRPTAAMRSSTERFAPPKTPGRELDFNPKGMGDVQKLKAAAAWSKGPKDVRPLPPSTTRDVPFYNPNTPGGTKTKVPSAAMRSTTARLDSPRAADIPFTEVKGMGAVLKKKASGAMLSTAPRLPEPQGNGPIYYDIKGGLGDVKKAPKASSWARSATSQRPTYQSKTPEFLNPTDPKARSSFSARAAFATQSERLPSTTSIGPGPGAYASPLVSAGMGL
eukprot:PhF_6_TR439/c0_g1_i1/m.163